MSKFKKMAKRFYKNWGSGGPYDMIQGTRTGFRDLDPVTGGLRPGELIMVAGRPAMGKTSFALNMVDNISVRGTGRSLYLTNDSSEQVIADRLIQIHAGVRGICFKKFEFYDEEEMVLDTERYSLTHAKVEIKNITGVSIYGLEDIVKMSCLNHSLDIVVVDDFRRLKEADNSSDQMIFSELKRIAKTYQVPVVILCSLSRMIEERDDHRPIIADVEISNAVVNSDFVFFLYRENYYEPTEETFVPLEIDIVKNPRGSRGTVVLKVYRDCFTMADYPGTQLLDMRQKNDNNCFCDLIDNWQEILAMLEFRLPSEKEYNCYIKPLELQTVSGKPFILTVIVPEDVKTELYVDNYKALLIEAIYNVTELNCDDIYFITQSEMDKSYEDCDKTDKGWS